ncbi:hypothetical protein CDL12_00871 [Handroanthus impetiginosus]|uniref:Uncharacterized protein n=1 Tax=Handroanthus impetiginosus TaxID=429701 RepID=A0A2G9I9D1_9LAMI|nr:hypothetical protein CDL12_00871 [Handroanthus impetiginosus]
MAYAAVVALAQNLKQLLQSDHLPPHYPKLELQSLHENVSSLQTSLEKFVLVPKNRRDAVKKLESRISDAIYKAQDAIESFLSKQSETEEIAEEQTVFLQELQEIIENISPIRRDTKEISDLIREQTGDSLSEDTRSAKTTFSTKIKIVGQDKDRKLVMDDLKSDTNEHAEAVSTLPPSSPMASPPETLEQVVQDTSTPPPPSPSLLKSLEHGSAPPPPPPSPKISEKVAQQYLEDLVARNLIFVRRNTSNGYIKTCGDMMLSGT